MSVRDRLGPPPLPWKALEEVAADRLGREARWLLRAVDLGRRGWGRVDPNPMVGCVLVRDGEVVGEGWHRVFGGDHAEIRALSRAGERARGSTAFVSLEPCNHHGKTPPCSRALASAGVSRLVFGVGDPSPEAAGGGEALRDAGLSVEGPILGKGHGRVLNPAFFHRLEGAGRPYLALKLALGLDGGIAAARGLRTAVSGPEAGSYTHRLRAGFEAVMVGSGTAEADDPLLTVRQGPEPRNPPVRLVLDTLARKVTTEAALLRDLPEAQVHLFCGPGAPRDRTGPLRDAGVRIHRVPAGRKGLELGAVLRVCWEEGITSILCEGGGRLAGSLLETDRVDRLYLYLAPRFLGPEAVPAFPFQARPPGARRIVTVDALGRDAVVVLDRGLREV